MARICLALVSAVLFLACQEASAQICKPVAERTGEVGCWIIANQSVGQLNKPETFWHLDVYATRAEAEAAKGFGSAVVEVSWKDVAADDCRQGMAVVRG